MIKFQDLKDFGVSRSISRSPICVWCKFAQRKTNFECKVLICIEWLLKDKCTTDFVFLLPFLVLRNLIIFHWTFRVVFSVSFFLLITAVHMSSGIFRNRNLVYDYSIYLFILNKSADILQDKRSCVSIDFLLSPYLLTPQLT